MYRSDQPCAGLVTILACFMTLNSAVMNLNQLFLRRKVVGRLLAKQLRPLEPYRHNPF